MRIIEYEDKYEKDAKRLLKELQEYIVKLDPYQFNLLNEEYENKCFAIDYNEVKNNNGIIYLAEDKTEVVGLIIGVVRKPVLEYDYERKFNMGEVTELIVSKNIRSKGVGKELLTAMEKYFRMNNCKTINIDVFGYNDIGKNFYFKNGYHTRMMTVSKKID